MLSYRKIIVRSLIAVVVVCLVTVIGGSFYMLDYSLSPDPNRADTDSFYRELFKQYPETLPWVDSLREKEALRDTFVTMPTGERHHALYIKKGGNKTAMVIHGWRDCSIDFLYIARLYERELGYNVVMPDLHAHGLSEGDMIQMGWLDRKDALHWLSLFQTDTMVVHGVSMGGATTMMMSAEELLQGIRSIRFIDDCGYTSVWDEFTWELKNQFGLPKFPLMYSSSLLCKLRYGWSFGEASAIKQVKKSPHDIFFIHGDKDTFVPTAMAYRLYEARPTAEASVTQPRRELWITEGAEHARSYLRHKDEYLNRVKAFLADDAEVKVDTSVVVVR